MLLTWVQKYLFESLLSILSEVGLLNCMVILLLLFFLNRFILFIYWLHWVFVAVCRLSLVVVNGGYSSLPCEGFSLRWLLVAEHRL